MADETDKSETNAPDADPLIGTTIDGRYRIDHVVGEGGFGCVYAARHLALDVRVALKVLKVGSDVGLDARLSLVDRFLEEARVLTRLKHPHVVSALDLGTLATRPDAPSTPYLVMEWCEGITLRDVLEERGPLPLRDAYTIAERLADALGHAHEMGVVHRDVKPSNVMMIGAGDATTPRLIDFGIAKIADPSDLAPTGATVTATGVRAFTPAYAAPEQVAGARTGPWTDVHAVALLFVQMVTGEPPYAPRADVGSAAIDPVRPRADRTGVETGPFEAVVERALAIKPQDRYADGRTLRDALREAARRCFADVALPVAQASVARTTPPRDAEPKPRPRTAWLVAGCAAALVLVGGVWLVRDPAPAEELPAASASPPPSASSSAAAVAAPTFCALTEADKKAIIRTTGFRGYGWQPSGDPLTSLRREGGGPWLTVGAKDLSGDPDAPSAAKTLLTRAADGLELLSDRGVAYALDDGCLVYVRGPTAEATRLLDLFVAGRDVEARGDTFGGPSPIPITPITSKKWDGAKAKTLGALTEGELIERIRATGATVDDAQRGASVGLSLSVGKGPHRGSVVYYPTPEAREQLPGLTRGASAKEPVWSAVDGEIVVVAFGNQALVDERFFTRVLEGLGARIETHRGN